MKKFSYLLAILPIVFFSFKYDTIPLKGNSSILKSANYYPNSVPLNSVFYPGSTVCESTNGLYTLIYQTDGNLVLYNSSHVALWGSGTVLSSPSFYFCKFVNTGNIILVNNNTTTYWYSNTETPGGTFISWTLQDDGNFVIYTTAGSAATGTEGGQHSSHPHTFE